MKNVILFFIAILYFSCNKEEALPLEPFCVDCIQYEYLQAYNDTSLTLSLELGIYCVGDSAFVMSNGAYYTIINDSLIQTMSESMFCTVLEINVIED
ncbi:hypothetical protein OAJ42_01395 [Flavobacteriales bacterium]|nr:hypothetical protein [Flavobacteriales bacterium]